MAGFKPCWWWGWPHISPVEPAQCIPAIVQTDECRCRVKVGEILQHDHNVHCLVQPAYPDHQVEATVLIDHIEELESEAIYGGVAASHGVV